MRRRRAIRFGAVFAIAGLGPGLGCTHNHYYYTSPGAVLPAGTLNNCDPAPIGTPVSSAATGQPALGAVCDEPPLAQRGSLVAQNPARTTPIVSNAARPIGAGPIYSQPNGRLGRRAGGLVWRGSNPESSLATTRIEGAYDDETTVK